MTRVGIDIETTGLAYDSDIHCIAVVDDDEQNLFVDLDKFMNYMSIKHWPVPIFHNALFDKVILERRGLCPPGGYSDWEDTMLMAYILSPGSDVSLAALAPKVGTKKMDKPTDFSKFTRQMGLYCMRDAFITHNLFYELGTKMSTRLWEYYLKVEKPYQRIIEDVENGYYIDRERLGQAYKTQGELLHQAEVDFLSHFEDKVKVRKEKMLPKKKQNCVERHVTRVNGKPELSLLTWYAPDKDKPHENVEYHHCTFEYLRATHTNEIIHELITQGWKPEKFSDKTDKPTLDKSVLEELSHEFPLAKHTRRYARISRELSAYVDKIAAAPNVSEKHKLLKCNVNQCVTATTRLSMSEPPLQQIPVRDPDSRYIRKLFVPPEGYDLIIGDVSQFELRILAFYLEVYCEDSRMADVIRSGADMHNENAKAWFGENFTKEQRSIAKNSIFAVLYGAGAKKLAGMLGISKKAAYKLIDRIYATTAIEDYESAMLEMALDNGGILKGIAGNQWNIWEVFAEVESLRAAGTRACRNYPIQGTQAALMKIMQSRADKQLQESGLLKYEKPSRVGYEYIEPVTADFRTVMQVHDEAHIIVRKQHTQQVLDTYHSVFNNSTLLSFDGVSVPIKADFHVCDDWSMKG